jgi:hypothetical protein
MKGAVKLYYYHNPRSDRDELALYLEFFQF